MFVCSLGVCTPLASRVLRVSRALILCTLKWSLTEIGDNLQSTQSRQLSWKGFHRLKISFNDLAFTFKKIAIKSDSEWNASSSEIEAIIIEQCDDLNNQLRNNPWTTRYQGRETEMNSSSIFSDITMTDWNSRSHRASSCSLLWFHLWIIVK